VDDGKHSITTVSGDSGAPLFNQGGVIVGIHTGGYKLEKVNTYQCLGKLPAFAGN
jgi:V8-like Glu-specific endopeptidase